MTAWIPAGYTPREYVHDLLLAAFPMAYAAGVDECDIVMFFDRPDGIADVQRYVADQPDADIPDYMRGYLRLAADGINPWTHAATVNG